MGRFYPLRGKLECSMHCNHVSLSNDTSGYNVHAASSKSLKFILLSVPGTEGKNSQLTFLV